MNYKLIFYLSLLFIINNSKIYSQKTNIELSGDILEIIIPSSALISTLVYNEKHEGTIQFVKSFGFSMIVTHSLKRIINKRRPNGGNLSFPSGHTTSAFAGAAFLERKFGWTIGISAYILAGYVGWSRVYSDNHDFYDVLAGASIGIISSYLFTKPYKNIDIDMTLTKTQFNFKFNYLF